MPFPGVFKRFSTADAMLFRQNASRIHARLGTMPSKCPRRSTTSHGSNVSQISACLNMRSMSFKPGNGCFTILFDGAYFLLAVMVEGDESSWRFWSTTGPY